MSNGQRDLGNFEVEEITLQDLAIDPSIEIDVERLREDEPHMVIFATRCECGEVHPFVFEGKMLYVLSHYETWHQHRECICGREVSVHANRGQVVYNPHGYRIKGRESDEEASQ